MRLRWRLTLMHFHDLRHTGNSSPPVRAQSARADGSRRYWSATAGPSRWRSDLGVAVLGGGRDLRDDIPVLDDLAVRVEAEDVDDLAAQWPVDRFGTGEQRVRDDEVAVGEGPLDVDVHVGERAREAGDEPDECVETVRRERVVLDVLID